MTIEDSKKNSPLLYEQWKENVAARTEAKKGDADAAITSAVIFHKGKDGYSQTGWNPDRTAGCGCEI